MFQLKQQKFTYFLSIIYDILCMSYVVFLYKSGPVENP